MASLRLPDRAVHVFFLTRFSKEKQPKGTGCLGDLKTFQVVNEFVKPATAKSKTNYIDCLVQGHVDKLGALSWCQNGTLTDVPGAPRAVGPTSYFVSHAWSYTFTGLVALVERHYASLPDTNGGKDFVPIYYWVDILAVTQHFSGNFTEHPDSDFPGVIRASKAVLFTMYPWRAPIAPTRVWCLFEALTAVESPGVDLEVLLDTGDSKDTAVQTVMAVASGVDVRSAQASVASDKSFIMGRIRDGVGVEAFNTVLRKRLRAALLEVALIKCLANRDNDSLVQLIKGGGARDPDGTLDVTRWLPCGTTENVVQLLDGLTPQHMPRRLVLSGRVAGQDGRWKAQGPNSQYDAPVWSYLPLLGKALAAVGRLLQRQGGGGGITAGGTASRHSLAAAVAASRPPPIASRRSLAATNSTAAAAATGEGDRAGGGGPTSSGVLQELWLSPAPAYDPRLVSYRPYWASLEYTSPEEAALHGKVDPDWHKKEARLKQAGTEYEANEEWKASVVVGKQRDAEAREKAERPARMKAEVAARSELWGGLGHNTSLTVLGLHRGSLSAKDVAGLAQALRQHRCLQVLQVVDIEPEDGYPGGAGALARGLLAAGLGSRSLQRLLLTPAALSLVEALEVPAAAAWDMGGGAALQELVLAPVALAPAAAKQLAELLAALPSLQGGCVDVAKAPPRDPPLPGSDSPPPRTYSVAERAPVYPRFAPRGQASDLAPVLQLRGTPAASSSRPATPQPPAAAASADPSSSSSSPSPAAVSPAFVAALTHFLAVNTEPPAELLTEPKPPASSSSKAGKDKKAPKKYGVGDHPRYYMSWALTIDVAVVVEPEPLGGRWSAEEHRKLLAQAYQAAPPEYKSSARRLLPHDRWNRLPPDAGGGAAAGAAGAAAAAKPEAGSGALNLAGVAGRRPSSGMRGGHNGVLGSSGRGTSGLHGGGGGGLRGGPGPDSDTDDDGASVGGGSDSRYGGISESLRLVIPKW